MDTRVINLWMWNCMNNEIDEGYNLIMTIDFDHVASHLIKTLHNELNTLLYLFDMNTHNDR